MQKNFVNIKVNILASPSCTHSKTYKPLWPRRKQETFAHPLDLNWKVSYFLLRSGTSSVTPPPKQWERKREISLLQFSFLCFFSTGTLKYRAGKSIILLRQAQAVQFSHLHCQGKGGRISYQRLLPPFGESSKESPQRKLLPTGIALPGRHQKWCYQGKEGNLCRIKSSYIKCPIYLKWVNSVFRHQNKHHDIVYNANEPFSVILEIQCSKVKDRIIQI